MVLANENLLYVRMHKIAEGVAHQILLMHMHDKLGGTSWCCRWPVKFDVTYAVGSLISGSCTFTCSLCFASKKANLKVVCTAKVLCHMIDMTLY